jgi:hypothetical protein
MDAALETFLKNKSEESKSNDKKTLTLLVPWVTNQDISLTKLCKISLILRLMILVNK